MRRAFNKEAPKMSKGRRDFLRNALAGAGVLTGAKATVHQQGRNAPRNASAAQLPSGTTRTFYIAADEVVWDYAPHGRNITELPIPEGEIEMRSAGEMKFIKAVYREYIDGTFKTLKPRPPEWEHLGILGPLIRAEVGDVVKVFFKNNTKIPYLTMHPHGLEYTKDSEGAMYAGSGSQGSHVEPGKTCAYTWLVPERAGPGPMDPSSILWM